MNCKYRNKSDDTISRAINVEGIDEQIRCEMCRNPMHTDRGCDGNCKYDENLYERIMQILGERIKPLPSAEQWIPCSERLPEFETKVLAWVENKDPKGRFNPPGIYTATLRDKIPQHDPEGKRNIWGIPGYDSEWSVWSWSYFTEPDVKAWMPLPEPYEED